MRYSDYINLLNQTKQHYRCVGFDVLLDQSALPENIALIRHDIDFSTKYALELAKIEADLGVQATYTIQLSAAFYSPMVAPYKRHLQEIHRLGHKIGLHFDVTDYEIHSEEDISTTLAMERRMLADVLSLPLEAINMFSFHNTSPFSLSCKKHTYAGMVNAYSESVFDHFAYVSDSNGYWRYHSWQDLLDERPSRIQVLCHPLWWSDEAQPPAKRIAHVLRDHANHVFDAYCELFDSDDNHDQDAQAKKMPVRENRTGLSAQHTRFLTNQGALGRRILFSYLQGNCHSCFTDMCELMLLALNTLLNPDDLPDMGSIEDKAISKTHYQAPSQLIDLAGQAAEKGIACHVDAVQKLVNAFFTLDLSTEFQGLFENIIDETMRIQAIINAKADAYEA